MTEEKAEPKTERVTSDVRAGARKLVPLALETLTKIMKGDGADASRIAAAREVLDRAGGKPKAGDGEAAKDGGLTVVVRRFGDGAKAAGPPKPAVKRK